MHKIPLIFLSLIILFACGCKLPGGLQHAVYFSDSVTEAEKQLMNNPVVIKPADRLTINITATNKIAAEDFNPPGAAGYLVDSIGNIELLQLGIIHVAGISAAQLKDTLQGLLEKYIKGALVTVSIINFQVNMMGEVGHPGTITVQDGKMNILQAITQAGDITQYGLRQNILVIREANGKREFGRIDISSNHVFESPYFYLQQNDIVYVEPDKSKFNDAAINRGLRNIGIFTSVVSVILLVINLTTR